MQFRPYHTTVRLAAFVTAPRHRAVLTLVMLVIMLASLATGVHAGPIGGGSTCGGC